ncbi:hypothetical protein FNU79_18420 [Deinococcus detaillensis]|uniref:Uncharacterized protein n=1 Tax=Deinococcus detaillensis TaxID=2592048 RepID=A0A553UGA9_9DEIO|nr:hypothetical protein [Deinococcus detaillensis]TSA79051.1 hypothetical protein FNU79_18420 [Deinococcus detaillensis]
MNRPLMNTVLILSFSFAAGSTSLANSVPASVPHNLTALSVNLQPTTADISLTPQFSSALAGVIKRILHNPPDC